MTTTTLPAMKARVPRDGEVKRTALPDTFDGIRFEVGRMVEYVQDASRDDVVLRNVQEISGRSPDAASAVRAIDAWWREHFVYVNDPPGIEVIQTPRRMVKETRVPPEVVSFAIAPLEEAMRASVGPGPMRGWRPPGIAVGDCDEAVLAGLSHAAAASHAFRIGPLFMEFGGGEGTGTLHHVWSRIHFGPEDKVGTVSDLTEPGYQLGERSEFAHLESVEVPIP